MCGRLVDRSAQLPLGNEGAQAHRRVNGRGQQRGRAGIDFGHHDHAQVLRFASDIGRAGQQHSGVDPFHAQAVGAGDALIDDHFAAHPVKGKAFRKHIAKVQCQPPRQSLQVEHSEQLGHAGLGLEKLARLHIHRKLPGHAWRVQAQG